MSLSDLASIGSLVSSIAVVISLVYLSVQVRQAERNQQASIRLARATRIIDLFMGTTEPSLADAVARGMQGSEDMTDTQIAQFTAYASARLSAAEDSFYQYREGVLNEFSFDAMRNSLGLVMAVPAMRVIYKQIRGRMGREFVEFADKVLAATPITTKATSAAHFRTELAAEKSAKPQLQSANAVTGSTS